METSFQPTIYRPFAQSTHFTRMPNDVLDYFLPLLSNSAYKVLTFFVRKTWGWDKQWDSISYSQIKAGTGIKSNSTIAAALRQLLALPSVDRKGVVHPPKLLRPAVCVVPGTMSKNPTASRYALNTEFEMEVLPEGRGRRRESVVWNSKGAQPQQSSPANVNPQAGEGLPQGAQTPRKSISSFEHVSTPVIESAPVFGAGESLPMRGTSPVIELENPTPVIEPVSVFGVGASSKIVPATSTIFEHTKDSSEEKINIRTRCASTTIVPIEGARADGNLDFSTPNFVSVGANQHGAQSHCGLESQNESAIPPTSHLTPNEDDFDDAIGRPAEKKAPLRPAEKAALLAIKSELYCVCGIEHAVASTSKRYEMHYAAKRLLRAGYTPQHLKKFARGWHGHWDKISPPSPNQVTENLLRMLSDLSFVDG